MLSAVLVLAAVIAAAHIVPATGSGKRYAVSRCPRPDRAAGRAEDHREPPASILRGQGFTVTEVKRPGLSTAAAGTVYAQDPVGGTLLPPGSAVTIYVQPAAALAIVAAPAALPVPQG